MRNPKYHLYLTPDERRIVINSLINFRNDLISQGRYTDIIDELLVKFTKAKVKRIKIKESCVMATKITYTQQGDYLLPDLKLPKQPKVEIGIWGKRHLRYIKQHHPIIYTNLLTSCKLTAYLADIDEEATEMFDRLVKQLAECEGVTELLKAENQMLWVRKMNNIRNRAVEIVNNDFIYT